MFGKKQARIKELEKEVQLLGKECRDKARLTEELHEQISSLQDGITIAHKRNIISSNQVEKIYDCVYSSPSVMMANVSQLYPYRMLVNFEKFMNKPEESKTMKIKDNRHFPNTVNFGDLPNGAPFLYTEPGSVSMLGVKAECINQPPTNITSLKDGSHYYLADNIRVVSLENSTFTLED